MVAPASSAPRALWKATLEVGSAVRVPVRLYTAVRPQEIHFHMLHDQDGVRIRQVLECPVEHKEVPREHAVKGFELRKGEYVIVHEEDLDHCGPVPSRTIQVRQFVEPGEIDPVFFEKASYLGPDEGGAKTYAVLAEAMKRSGRLAIVEYVLRAKQYLAALRVLELPRRGGAVLCLHPMRYADEVLSPEEAAWGEPEEGGMGKGKRKGSGGGGAGVITAKVSDRELAMAEQLVASLNSDFDPSRYRDEYRACVMEMIQKKAAGEEVRVQPPPGPRATKPRDLTAMLKASIDAAKKRRKAG
jgi:DNA end-binding protein Ku